MRAVIGLGANLGDRLTTMRQAVRALAEVPGLRVERTSLVYATTPVGGPAAQPEYLNAAALVTCDAAPEALLDALLGIEAQLGRVRRERWGPRVIDLDVLWIEGVAFESARLVVPHPRLRERAFALGPMLELVPDATDPVTGERYVVPAGDLRATVEAL
jgi:2-amino-4-hydroxy-6-hydroxymethyldihydropteridine diphosphokinase